MMQRKHYRYNEGQWFAIPLRRDSYSLGIVVRGSYKTKIGLGYFFGPKYAGIPTEKETWEKHPMDAILIRWFGDLGIVSGRWPLIQSTRQFSREEWPIPKFGRKFPLPIGKGIIVEYGENKNGVQQVIREIPVDEEKITGLPDDGILMGGAVEILLTNLLDSKS